MSKTVQISILVATYNRAALLRQTLESLAQLAPAGITHEILVVDNNSTDDTAAVIQSFEGRAPVRYVFEGKQGKNAALNTGLDAARGELIVFTDDDVLVPPGWLDHYWSAAVCHPEHDFFGGNVVARFPPDAPAWARLPCMDFAALDYGAKDRALVPEEIFYGPNMAVRARVFQAGIRMNETIGPSARTTRKGSETSLQIEMWRRGYTGWFVAGPAVEHRVDAHPWMFSRRYQWKRRFQAARGQAYLESVHLGNVRLLGLRAYPFFVLLQACRSTLASWARFWNEEQRITAEMRLAGAAGVAWEVWTTWRIPVDARRTAPDRAMRARA